jgi:hypothetical protein
MYFVVAMIQLVVTVFAGCAPSKSSESNSDDIFTTEHIQDSEYVKRRLDGGLDPNTQNTSPSNQDHLITYAIRRNAIETVRILIESGANVDIRSAGFEKTPIFQAAYQDRLEIASLLIEAGANVNAVDVLGNNALRESILGKNLEMTRLLLESGADPAQTNKEGQTMSEIAQQFGTPEIKRMFE